MSKLQCGKNWKPMELLNGERRQPAREKPREEGAMREFRRILQESGAKIRQGEGGRGAVPGLPRWEPFAREAEAVRRDSGAILQKSRIKIRQGTGRPGIQSLSRASKSALRTSAKIRPLLKQPENGYIETHRLVTSK